MEEQAKDEVWSEVIQWVEAGKIQEKAETRGKPREVMVAKSMFDPEMFKMWEGVVMFTKATNRNKTGDVWQVCLPESMVSEVWGSCHQSIAGGHKGVDRTLNTCLKGLYVLSTRQKICVLSGGCDTCLTKEQSMPVRTQEHVPSLTEYVGYKL